MATISLRLPDELAEKLDRETRIEKRGRSDIVREALDRYLAEKERKRLMETMVREARALYADPAQAGEAREAAEDFLPAENEALERGQDEGGAGKWWK
jgi:metal-responsive CopG/Arc/MetJ family transcriptional regulator